MIDAQTTYRLQAGCHDCVHRFAYVEYDRGTVLFCTLDAPKRPSCGSVAMGEIITPYDEDAVDKQGEAWDKWSENRSVHPAGVCRGYSYEILRRSRTAERNKP